MCGIAGIIAKSNLGKQHLRKITSMCNILRHRGPDDEGYLSVGTTLKSLSGNQTHGNLQSALLSVYEYSNLHQECHFVLGHRRLSILDHSKLGHQPMSDAHQQYWIAYNGEIYNYIELKTFLRSKGYEFKSATDTEVILAAYAHWGEECVNRFEGMWSFVIYDHKRRKILASRDRFGIKPLYYFENDDLFVFASEQKAIVQQDFYERRINDKAVFDYLVSGQLEHESESFFQGIKELKPSNNLVYNLKTNTYTKNRYYNLNFETATETFNKDRLKQYALNTKKRVEKAIQSRLHADVTIGASLSGGIDSSLIACLMNEVNDHSKVNLLTVGFPNYKPIDETKWAKIVVDNTQSNWQLTLPNHNNFINDLSNLVYLQDVPFFSTSTYAQFALYKLAKEKGIKVIMDGQGGDELFTGYPHYNLNNWVSQLKKGNLNQLVNSLNHSDTNWNNFKYLSTELFKAGVQLGPTKISASIIKSRKPELQFIQSDFWNSYEHRMRKKSEIFQGVNQQLHTDFTQHKFKELLKNVDRNSMHHSVECRLPFADDLDLIESTFRIPSNYKLHNGISKLLIREAFKEKIPSSVLKRYDKIGFAAPHYNWMLKSEHVLKSILYDTDTQYINGSLLAKNFKKLVENQPKETIGSLWRLVNFSLWKQIFKM